MTSTKKIGLIWANPYSSNLGVAALAYSALIIFQDIAQKRGLLFDYTLWGSRKGKLTIQLDGKNSLVVETQPAFMGGDVKRILKDLIKRPWVMLNYKYLQALRKCDLLADIGEGDSYADIYGIERFKVFDYVKQKCIHSNPYILLPQTIGPFYSDEALKKARISLKESDAVIARDKQSYEYCKQIEPETNLHQSIDMAFFLPYIKGHQKSSQKLKVGVNISGLLWEGGYTKNNQFGLADEYQEVILPILNYLKDHTEYEVHLIGHVISQKNNRHLEIDEDMHVLEKIHQNFPNFILAPAFTTPIEAKSYISSMDFFTGARMHACIAAISSGVPVLPMSYSRKFNGLFQETLSYPPMIDLKEHTRNEALELFMKYLQDRKELKLRISEIEQNIITPEKTKMINLISTLIK